MTTDSRYSSQSSVECAVDTKRQITSVLEMKNKLEAHAFAPWHQNNNNSKLNRRRLQGIKMKSVSRGEQESPPRPCRKKDVQLTPSSSSKVETTTCFKIQPEAQDSLQNAPRPSLRGLLQKAVSEIIASQRDEDAGGAAAAAFECPSPTPDVDEAGNEAWKK